MQEFHGKVLSLADATNRTVIVSVRDPLSRVISAFNARHPRGGQSPFQKAAHVRATEYMFYKCFKELNDWANALNGSDYCGELARSAISLNCTKANTHLSIQVYKPNSHMLNDEARIPLRSDKAGVRSAPHYTKPKISDKKNTRKLMKRKQNITVSEMKRNHSLPRKSNPFAYESEW